MSAPLVSFIICTYNRDAYIEKALRCVANQKTEATRFELIVIDNKSTDSTASICSRLQAEFTNINFHYYLEENQGLSHARNRGIKEAQGEILVYLDDDAFIDDNYCEKLISFYQSNSEVSCTGGKTIPLFENGKPTWMSNYLLPLVAAVDLGEKAKPFPFNQFPIGANMAVRKSVVTLVGLFDVNLGRKGKNLQGGEEKDFFNRIRALGHIPWYLPDTLAHHVIPASRMSKEFIRKQAHGIGFSERLRVKSIGGNAVITKYFSEIAKWFATFVLCFFYGIILQPAKAIMLVRFRFWVSGGLFRGIE